MVFKLIYIYLIKNKNVGFYRGIGLFVFYYSSINVNKTTAQRIPLYIWSIPLPSLLLFNQKPDCGI